jgi:hypothetical protein
MKFGLLRFNPRGCSFVTLRSSPPLEVISSSSWTRTRPCKCYFELVVNPSFMSMFSCINTHFQMHAYRWTCYMISVPSGGLVPWTNPNQSVMNMFGVPKYTVNSDRHRVELALLGFICQAVGPLLPHDQSMVLWSNIGFGRYWFEVLPLHVVHFFKTGYSKKPEYLLPGTSLRF